MTVDTADSDLLEALFAATNTYGDHDPKGLWPILQPLLPPNRTHTSLSVGDRVTINGQDYLCAPMGWRPVAAAEIVN